MSAPIAPSLAPSRLPKGGYAEPALNWSSSGPWKRLAAAVVVLAFVALCLVVAKVDPAALIKGMPRLLEWASTAWPPYTQELDVIAYRAFETVAIATVGTLAAALLAAPLAMLVAHNTAPLPWLAMPLRWFANACRGIDTVVFAILFVAAVGLGPFAGVLGMIVHSLGVLIKLNSEAIETLPRPPLEAAAMSGAAPAKVMSHAVLPAVLPNLASVSLYVWEANVRTSTVLGIVGAGGIGFELMAALRLIQYDQVAAILLTILACVVVVDGIGARLRKRLK